MAGNNFDHEYWWRDYLHRPHDFVGFLDLTSNTLWATDAFRWVPIPRSFPPSLQLWHILVKFTSRKLWSDPVGHLHHEGKRLSTKKVFSLHWFQSAILCGDDDEALSSMRFSSISQLCRASSFSPCCNTAVLSRTNREEWTLHIFPPHFLGPASLMRFAWLFAGALFLARVMF